MSRGPGNLQRRILDLFHEKPDLMPDSLEVAGRIADRYVVTESEAVSTRRALRGLARRGLLVDMGRHWRGGRRRWAMPDEAIRYQDRVKRVFGNTR